MTERGGRGGVRSRLGRNEVARRVLAPSLRSFPRTSRTGSGRARRGRRAPSHVVDGHERAAEDLERPRERLVGEGAPHEEALGLDRAHRQRGDAAVGEPGVADDLGLVQVDGKGRRHDADVKLAALAHLEGARPAHEPGGGPDRHEDAEDNLVPGEERLPVPHEEVGDGDRALCAPGPEHDRGVERQEHRRQFADGRGRRRCCPRGSRGFAPGGWRRPTASRRATGARRPSPRQSA